MEMKAPRQEPSFEGDRQAANMRQLTRRADVQIEEEERDYPIARTGGPSDYAKPEVRALQNVEEEIRRLGATEIPAMERARDIGNSTGMKKAQQIVNDAVTAAHDDTCRAIDTQVEECRALLVRIEKGAEAHKTRLKEAGQLIARTNGAAIQELLRTAEWYEKQAPNLREPKLETPKEETPSAER
jgi:hypothetical protein